MITRIHLEIYGRVQGVCFRHYCREQAEHLGLKGFVRNDDDGSVEVVAEGEDMAVNDFLAWCRRGPPPADVRGCEEKHETPTDEFDSFTIGY